MKSVKVTLGFTCRHYLYFFYITESFAHTGTTYRDETIMQNQKLILGDFFI